MRGTGVAVAAAAGGLGATGLAAGRASWLGSVGGCAGRPCHVSFSAAPATSMATASTISSR